MTLPPMATRLLRGPLRLGVERGQRHAPRQAHEGQHEPEAGPADVGEAAEDVQLLGAWEKQVLSARGLKRVGRHSEHAI
jgi:hypothetical protein